MSPRRRSGEHYTCGVTSTVLGAVAVMACTWLVLELVREWRLGGFAVGSKTDRVAQSPFT
ncbi:hypothetical protein [Halarchaeum sp. P4]|uniref:hypothetical protein n=1 Tax=Halarchaeum sp. P4 TaxID=3421639 RepID=UPI003EBB10DE